jgi:hypothetical protein
VVLLVAQLEVESVQESAFLSVERKGLESVQELFFLVAQMVVESAQEEVVLLVAWSDMA